MPFDPANTKTIVDRQWDATVIPTLKKFIEVENESPSFNYDDAKAWEAATLIVNWVKTQIADAYAEVKQINKPVDPSRPEVVEKRTPCVLIVVEGTKDAPDNALLYGHFDKQPPFPNGQQWTPPYHPHKPYFDEATKKLYGRGGADDGYAVFALVTAIVALKEQSVKHDRYVIIIEGDEESGNGDVEAYVEEFKDIIKIPSLIVCTDSGGANYSELWLTNSLRGIVNATVDARILIESVHSGSGSGIIADSFHIQRTIMDRLDPDHTGVITHPALNIEITQEMKDQAKELAGILGESVYNTFKFVPTGKPVTDDIATLIINNTLKPTLCIIGVKDIPEIGGGATGNSVRTNTTFMFSVRLPPGLSSKTASDALRDIVKGTRAQGTFPPFGAEISYTENGTGSGWLSPPLKDLGWLYTALVGASRAYFNTDKIQTQGQGGSIPLISHLADLYPNAKFVVTGVLGPGSNAHGIDESLDTIYGKQITATIAYIFNELANQK